MRKNDQTWLQVGDDRGDEPRPTTTPAGRAQSNRVSQPKRLILLIVAQSTHHNQRPVLEWVLLRRSWLLGREEEGRGDGGGKREDSFRISF